MVNPDEHSTSTRGRQSKVARLIETYGLQGIGPQLEDLWTTDEKDRRRSLRQLADLFNKQVLRSTMENAHMQLLDGEVENIYRLLTDDSVSNAERTRTRRRLERDEIDVEQLKEDFVSYQSMRTYLTKHRNAQYENTTDQLESFKETIQQLQSRAANVTESKINRLKAAGELSIGKFRIVVDIKVFCEDCQTQTNIVSLFDEGRCGCE